MAMLNDLGKNQKNQGNRSFNGDTTHLEMVGTSAIFPVEPPEAPAALFQHQHDTHGERAVKGG